MGKTTAFSLMIGIASLFLQLWMTFQHYDYHIKEEKEKWTIDSLILGISIKILFFVIEVKKSNNFETFL